MDDFRTAAALRRREDARPVLRAIRAAWAPSTIQVSTGEFAVDSDETVMLHAEEVTRAEE